MDYNENEFIKLNRKIIGWEWYQNINVKTLFIHCLLKANWKAGRFEGKDIERGSFVTSLDSLSKETGLSVRQVRTALDKLFLTGELTSKSYSKYRIITVSNYEQYQSIDKQHDNHLTSKRQASDKQVTTIEEVKKKRTKEVKNNNNPPISPLREMIEEKDYPDILKAKLNEWLKYKSEKKQTYQPTGFKTLLNKVDKAYTDFGAEAVAGCFDKSMENSWQGVFFDKLQKQKQQFDADEFLKGYE